MRYDKCVARAVATVKSVDRGTGIAIGKVLSRKFITKPPSAESVAVLGQKCVGGQSVQFRGSTTLSTMRKEGRWPNERRVGEGKGNSDIGRMSLGTECPDISSRLPPSGSDIRR